MRKCVLAPLGMVLLLAADALPNAGTNLEAEKLFRAMEEKLSAARTLTCAFEIKMDERFYAGSLAFGEGNRVRVEMNERADGRALRLLLVSDGTQTHMRDNGGGPWVHNTPKNHNAELVTSLVRAGVFLPWAPLPDVKVADAKERFPVSDFRLSKAEKIGDRATQRLEYRLVVKGNQAPPFFSVVIWLDLKTGLPVRRTIAEGSHTWVTETYSKLQLNAKLDAKTFDLP